MKKHGMLNSSITKVLADLGHTDWLVIADAGLPVPKDVPKIDLALTPGTPSFKSVVKAVCDDMVIEKVIAAEEVKVGNPDQLAFLNEQFPNLIAFVPHEDFKKMIEKAKAVIRTGEMTAYSNCILQAGVFF